MQQSFSFLAELKSLFVPLKAPETEDEAIALRETQVQFVRLILPMALVNLGNGAAVALAYAGPVGVPIVSAWFFLVLAFSSMQIAGGLRLMRTEVPQRVSGRMLRKAEMMSALLGLVWGSTIIVFRSESALANQFLSIIIAGMGAGTVAILGPVSRISSRFLIASMTVMLIATYFYQDPFGWATIFMCLTLTLALIVGSSRNKFHVQQMVGRQVEADRARNHLLDAIESTNDAFAFYDVNGNLALGNAQHKAFFSDSDQINTAAAALDGTETVRVGNRWFQRGVRKTAQGGYVVVNTDITNLKTRERELVEARREAIEADEAKSRFLSTMSHELRTPLNIILGFSRLMASDSQVKLSPSEVSEYSDNINESGTHLLRLIDDIIDYSKVGLDRFMLETQPVDLRDMIKKSVTLAANFEHVEDLSLIDVSISPRLGTLRIDDRVCRRIIMSLLTNAMRFRSGDARIVVRAGLDAEDRPFIAIRDFGNGIPEEELERVFEAFYQTNSGLDRSVGGTGLGLTLCRHLARLHGGDVVLKSRVGVGTTATLILPQTTYIPLEQEDTEQASQVA